jgi:DNA-binding NarL/FixJ family response regulator
LADVLWFCVRYTESGDERMKDRIIDVFIDEGQAHARSAMRLLLAQEPDIVVVGEAADVDTAVSAVAVCRPDVVLLDWGLPGQNNGAVMDDLRLFSPESSVIALSGLPEARYEALAAGVDSFVSKSDPPEKLLAAVGSYRRRWEDI